MGQREPRCASITEAVTHYRKLAAANPDAFLPDLAASLNNPAAMQARWGRRSRGFVHRRGGDDPAEAGGGESGRLPARSGDVVEQSSEQAERESGRRSRMASIAEAVTHYRKLAAANPDAFLPNLAGR